MAGAVMLCAAASTARAHLQTDTEATATGQGTRLRAVWSGHAANPHHRGGAWALSKGQNLRPLGIGTVVPRAVGCCD